MVEINQPRYHDRVVLVGAWKWSRGYDMPIRIKYGAYKGDYRIPNKALAEAPLEYIKSKTGRELRMLAVPLDLLEKIGGENE